MERINGNREGWISKFYNISACTHCDILYPPIKTLYSVCTTQNTTKKGAKWSTQTWCLRKKRDSGKTEACIAGSGVYGLQLTWWRGKGGKIRAVVFSHGWGLWGGSGVICGDSTVPRCWHSLHLLGTEGGIAPGLIIYRPLCLQKMFCEDTLRNPLLQGLLIGSELSFINGTYYMQV